MLFGDGLKPVVASKLVQAELARLAYQKGETRAGCEDLRKAVSNHAIRYAPERTVPKALRRIRSIDDLRNFDPPLPPPPKPKKASEPPIHPVKRFFSNIGLG